jgi:poly-gamma-glutamate synthesis protein (capsule biosynthesis protein)
MTEALLAIVVKLTMAMMAQQNATMLFVGDAMMHQAQIDAARQANGTYNYTECFAQIKNEVETADYAVVNLETPLGTSNFTGYPCFNAPIEYAQALKLTGFDLFLTANNHTLDRRDRGLRCTIAALDSLHVEHIGTYNNAAQRSQVLPLIRDINGFKVGFLNYTYATNGIEVRSDAIVDYINRDTIEKDVKATRDAGAEIVVVAMHWGEEYVLKPVKSQRILADFLANLGVDVIVGGHPHVVEPMEIRTNPSTGTPQVITYSLGNFISNMKTRDTRGGAMLKVMLKRDSLGVACVDSAAMSYVFTVPPTASVRNFVVYPIDSVPQQWQAAATAFKRALAQ